MGLYNNGYRLGNTPFTSRIGALTTIYNGQGVHGRSAVPTGWTRGILKLTTNYDSLPQGCRHPKAWMMPQKPGALASRNYATGSGTMSADAWAVKLAEAAITGSGGLTAFGSLIVQLVAAITGSGTVTNADVKAFLAAVAALTGSGTISSAVRTGLGALLASVTGSGTAAGSTATGIGELDADIVAYGDLTPEGIRDAVWNAIAANFNAAGTMGNKLNSASAAGDPWTAVLPGSYAAGEAGNLVGNALADIPGDVWAKTIEAGYTAEELLRIFAAVLAGKVSGGGTGTETFKGIDDATNRVVADVDSNGNRSNITLDPT